jgi:hypothetical protein
MMLKKVPLSGATYNNDLLNYQGFILNSLLHLSMTFQVPPKNDFRENQDLSFAINSKNVRKN